MGAVALGPFVLATDRLAAMLGIGAFLLFASILASRRAEVLRSWSMQALLAGVVAARIGHVVAYRASFAEEPLRAFAVWQGGFSLPWAAAAVFVVSMVRLRGTAPRGWATACVAAGLIVWNTSLRLTEAATTSDGQPIPQLTLQQLDGPPVELAAMDGRPRVLNLWATWCPPCRREMPMLARAARETPQVDFLFVNQGEERDRIARYLRSERLVLPHVLLDSGGAVAGHFGLPGIPVTMFFAANGRLRRLHVGEVSPEILAWYLAEL